MMKVVASCINTQLHTLRNIHTNARENITRTRAKRKAGYFFVPHFVLRAFVGWYIDLHQFIPNFCILGSTGDFCHQDHSPDITETNLHINEMTLYNQQHFNDTQIIIGVTFPPAAQHDHKWHVTTTNMGMTDTMASLIFVWLTIIAAQCLQ